MAVKGSMIACFMQRFATPPSPPSPSLQVSHPSPIISSKAMRCLARLCLLLPSLSLSHLPLIVSKAKLSPRPSPATIPLPAAVAPPPTALHLAAMQALVDLLMWRVLPAIASASADPVPAGRQVMWQAVRELCALLPMADGQLDREAVERMTWGGEETGGMEGAEGEGEGMEESDGLMGVLCEGVAKLLVRWPEMKVTGDEREGAGKDGVSEESKQGGEDGEGGGGLWSLQQQMLHFLVLAYLSPATGDCHR